MKHTKKILIVLTVVWIMVLTVMFSNAWIARNWTPSIQQTNITIASSSALLISLEEMGGELLNSVSLNTIFNTDSFTLRQVSSADGITFHTVDFLPTIEGFSPQFTRNNVEGGEVDGKYQEGRYIDMTFYLRRQMSNNPELATDKLVFIHPESHIESTDGSDISDAIRVAITIDDRSPVILSNCDNKYNGFRDVTASNSNANGKDVYVNYDPTAATHTYNGDAVATQTSYSLHYYHGGRTEFDGDDDPSDDYDFTPVPDRALIRMGTGQTCKVNIKIWLEGGDTACTDGIAGKAFDFLLKFDSVDIAISDTGTTE